MVVGLQAKQEPPWTWLIFVGSLGTPQVPSVSTHVKVKFFVFLRFFFFFFNSCKKEERRKPRQNTHVGESFSVFSNDLVLLCSAHGRTYVLPSPVLVPSRVFQICALVLPSEGLVWCPHHERHYFNNILCRAPHGAKLWAAGGCKRPAWCFAQRTQKRGRKDGKVVTEAGRSVFGLAEPAALGICDLCS